jgi:hypothetical protein
LKNAIVAKNVEIWRNRAFKPVLAALFCAKRYNYKTNSKAKDENLQRFTRDLFGLDRRRFCFRK